MSTARRAAQSIGTNWLSLAINVLISFFLAPFVVRHLGGIEYGIWAVAMQFTGYLYLLDFGVRESVVRYTAKYVARGQQKRLNDVLTTCILIYVPVTLLCIAATLLFTWLVPQWTADQPEQTRVASLVTLFVGLTVAQTFIFNIFTGVLHGLQRFDVVNLNNIAGTLVRTAGTIALLLAGFGVVALTALNLAIAIISGLVLLWQARRLLRESGVGFRLTRLKRRRILLLGRKVLGYGWYVLVNNVAQKITFASDAIIIGIAKPAMAVTSYVIAGNLVEIVRTLMFSAAQVFNPISSSLIATRRTAEIGPVLVSAAKLTVLIALPIAITFALLGKEFIGLWMEPKYMEASGQVLMVLGLLQVASAPHFVISSVLYGMSRHRSIAMMRVGEAIVKLGLSIWLVKVYGIMGVAIGTAIPHVILALTLFPLQVKRHIGLPVWRFLVGVYRGPLLAALPFTLVLLAVKEWLALPNLLVFFVYVGLATLVFAASVYALALAPTEKSYVDAALRKVRARLAPS